MQKPTLIHALNGTVIEQTARVAAISGPPAGIGEPAPELRCMELPGLARDDARVLVIDSADEHGQSALTTDDGHPLRPVRSAPQAEQRPGDGAQ